jgi:hypothetical protein
MDIWEKNDMKNNHRPILVLFLITASISCHIFTTTIQQAPYTTMTIQQATNTAATTPQATNTATATRQAPAGSTFIDQSSIAKNNLAAYINECCK